MDQLKHVRLQNDTLALQVEANRKKESRCATCLHPITTTTKSVPDSNDTPTSNNDSGGNGILNRSLAKATTLDLVNRAWELVLTEILDSLPTVMRHIPKLFEAVKPILYRPNYKATAKARANVKAKDKPKNHYRDENRYDKPQSLSLSSLPDRISSTTHSTAVGPGLPRIGANGKQANIEQRLMADKANLKSLLREQVSLQITHLVSCCVGS